MNNWQAELSQYLTQVERETNNFLTKIDPALRDSGLEFDKRVRKHFLNCVDKRLDSVLHKIDIDLMLNDRSDDSSIDSLPAIGQKRKDWGSEVKNAMTKGKIPGQLIQNKPIKRLQNTKKDVIPKRVSKGCPRGNFKKKGFKRFQSPHLKNRRERERKRPYPNQTTSSASSLNHTQVSVVSSSSFSQTKLKHEAHPYLDATFKSIKLASADSANALEQIHRPSTHLLNLRYHCFHCSTTQGSYGCIEDVYVHWLAQHRDKSETKPFQFRVVENVACYFCDLIDSYPMVLEHQQMNHPNESIVIVAEYDHTKCALCPYSGDALIGHFEIEHELLLQLNDFNPLGLDDETLNRLLLVDAQKRFCGPCYKFFDTQVDAIAHHSVKHPEDTMEYEPTNDGEILYLICPCQAKIDYTEYYSHILGHFREFECSQCNFQANTLINFVEHDKNTHQTSTLKFRCMELSDQLMKYYFATSIVFSNGLVLIMHNVLRTKFDISNSFKNVIEKVLGTKKDNEPKVNGREEKTRETKKMMENVRSDKSSSLMSPKTKKRNLTAQNRYSSDLAVEGIPPIERENLQAIFLAICKKIGAKIVPDDIIFIRRYPYHQHKIVHVRLEKRSNKIHILDKRRNQDLKAASFINLPPTLESTQIFINPYMTKYFCSLCKLAKEAVKKKKLCFFNVDEKGVFIKRKQSSHGTHILSEDELFNYIKHSKNQKE
ncbi:uncharacterized protein LOC129573824 [Sitodiplosis mosellana]|uniref:uncharacterized protein LOC129573824 n=1 Tax=Sitodiplosis mosellana TaxID=263140 RepID=UPI0024449955|nr:uncharacterized protein LOC129573824 [Sitodiplosis mosellana]